MVPSPSLHIDIGLSHTEHPARTPSHETNSPQHVTHTGPQDPDSTQPWHPNMAPGHSPQKLQPTLLLEVRTHLGNNDVDEKDEEDQDEHENDHKTTTNNTFNLNLCADKGASAFQVLLKFMACEHVKKGEK